MASICVIGTGYVGMATMIGLAELANDVRGYDILEPRIRALQAGNAPYREAGIDEALQRNLSRGNVRFYERLEDAIVGVDYVVVCVGTPSLADGACDLSQLFTAMRALANVAPAHAAIVLRSTVPPGTTRHIQKLAGGRAVIYAPEFLREGAALADFLHPDRIIVGASDEVFARTYAELLAALDCPVHITGWEDAELIKCCSNAFLAMKISFANQISAVCDSVGADARQVLQGVGADSRIGERYLEPGIGFSGPCFEKDVQSLISVTTKHRVMNDLFTATMAINEKQPLRIIDIIESEAGAFNQLRIGVWGLAFKAGTSDTRNSLAVSIVEMLVRRGSSVCAYDPEFTHEEYPRNCRVASSAVDAADCDVLLILTEWPEFAAVDIAAIAAKIRRALIIDGRNMLDPSILATHNIRYIGIGRRVLAAGAHPTSLPLAV